MEADALSRGVQALMMGDSLEGLDKAIVSSVTAKEESKRLSELRKYPHMAEVICLVERGDLVQVVSIPDWKNLLRVADFMLEKRELKVCLESGKSVFMVPKAYRYEMFF